MNPKTNQDLIESIGLIGQSDGLAKVADDVSCYLDGSTNVLIIGEFGCETGAVAKAFHTLSGMDEKYLFRVDCREFATDTTNQRLIEFLFGVKAGSYPGALKNRCGYLDQMTQGTLIFEQIHELSVLCQNAISRFVDTKTYQRQGEWSVTRESRVRLIFTAAADLKKRILDGQFTEAFCSRLGIRVVVPPLRDRPDDIEPLLNHYLDLNPAKLKPRFSMDALEYLKKQKWPANLLDLESFISRVMLGFRSQELITLLDLQQKSATFHYDFNSQ